MRALARMGVWYIYICIYLYPSPTCPPSHFSGVVPVHWILVPPKLDACNRNAHTLSQEYVVLSLLLFFVALLLALPLTSV